MGSNVSLFCALLLLLHYGREGAALEITTTSTGKFLTGDNINLTISYDSNKSGTVTWAVNGTIVASLKGGSLEVSETYKNRLTVSGTGSLLITNTTKSDAGNYSVTVTITGEKPGSRDFQVTFSDRGGAALDITTTSTGSFLTGDNINLTISYNSDKATVIWVVNGITVAIWMDGHPDVFSNYQNRTTITGNGSLLITNTSKSDAGTYSVTVAVPGEKPASRDFQVTFSEIEGATLAITTTSTGKFLIGDDINIPISYNSNKTGTVAWAINDTTVASWKDGSLEVQETYKNRLTITDFGSLHITNTSPSDAGNYSVTLTVTGKKPALRVFQVTFSDAALEITTTSTDSFQTGDDITLIISYNYKRSATVTWAVNGTIAANWKGGSLEVSDTYKNRLKITGDGSLLIANTSKSDAGYYSVTVTVVDKKPVSLNFTVTFYDRRAPLDIRSTSTGNFQTSNDISLAIWYDSSNNGTVIWTVNGTTVAAWKKGASLDPLKSDAYNSTLTITGNGSLHIASTSKSDVGNYSVTVAILGEKPASRDFQVTFYDLINNVTILQSPEAVNEGTPIVNLTCNASSGIETVTWKKNGQSVGYNDNYFLLDGNQTLQIKHPDRTFTRIYTCNISNPVNWKNASLLLNVSCE
ncbi:uncharacterized protein LOC142106570 [Mixophyes fleayi]|uniref:uncharacterized protein LOC142106570 n=1 Tax=Mixophyes fleayi TaxID=3061075 RepID=UPI003F4DDEC3